MIVFLNEHEYNYLKDTLLENRYDILSTLEISQCGNSIRILLTEEIADKIRELSEESVGINFDSDYNPTPEGKILESFIDKFYVR